VIAGTQVRLLDQEIVRRTIGDRRLTIGGIGLGIDTPADRRTIAQLEAGGDRGDIRILVAHRPDAVLALSPKTRIDLVVAGHTHGGQVVVPLLGPPITFTRVPRHVAAGGFHDLGGRRIYVSRGVGCERSQAPRIRFGAPPEITLLTLVPARSP
ncbi:MAG: phosphohydrolase, partial [Planctomycetes bacterium]|nr:phosphohydrolase [Planctomycetota bacterium]